MRQGRKAEASWKDFLDFITQPRMDNHRHQAVLRHGSAVSNFARKSWYCTLIWRLLAW
jgi:hypothetical protein